MILKTKVEILNWLKKYDGQYKKNIETNCYELIDIHDIVNQSLLEQTIQREHLPQYDFEPLKNEDHQYIVNAKGDVNISNEKLKEIPFQFYQINGNFYCHHTQLISLKGCPQYIGDGFYCHNNQLTSLKGGPQMVGGNFSCHYNQLASLEYCPQSVGATFYCDYNQLTSLEYFPEIIKNDTFFRYNLSLLKYRNESHDNDIKNMSDEAFLNQTDFSFWHQFHIQEKFKIDNENMIEFLNLKNEDKHAIQKINKKKV